MSANPIKETFKAWIDTMPGSSHTLIVVGQVEMPTSGWHVGLRPAQPPGINPAILILQLEAAEPSGRVLQVITKLDVRYEESPPRQRYTQVTIRSGQVDITIDVGITS